MSNLGKSKKILRKSKNMTRKVYGKVYGKAWGGVKPVTAAAIKTASKKLIELNNDTTPYITPGQLSSSLPAAIKAAKEAITYANQNPGDVNARELAEIKIKIADYWTGAGGKRRNWRKETRLEPNHNARDWYEPGQVVIWRLKAINESAKRRMNVVLPDLIERVRELELQPHDDENAVKGKEYRRAKRRFERRQQGLDSASPSLSL
jgi:hypothetical protein